MSEQIAHIVIIMALNAWIAFRYAFQPLGPDEGIWMLSGWTGARYGRDYVDCKPPGIHIWFWLLAKLTKRNIWAAKFLHHLTVGVLIVISYLLSGSFGTALMATAILQSGWLRAYQSWQDQVSGVLLLLVVLSPPYWAAALVALACFFNVKAVIGGIYLLLAGYWIPSIVVASVAGAIVGLLYIIRSNVVSDVWISSIDVPRRMATFRKQYFPFQIAFGPMLLIVPFILVSLYTSMDYRVWATVMAYCVLNAWGRVWRSNHWLPLGLLAALMPSPEVAFVVLAAEWVSCRFYMGNVWSITYPEITQQLLEARMVGERMREEQGSVWCNTFHTQIYVYSQKKPVWNQVEQLEIADVTPERGRDRDMLLRKSPPKWIIIGPGSIKGQPRGYQSVGAFGKFVVLG